MQIKKNTIVRIATRKSALALWQAHYVKTQLERHHQQLTVRIVPMSTKGDKILDTPLAKIGGKGLFVKELELAMLEGVADIAVHSMKDVPVDFQPELMLHTICEREDPRDAFVSNHYQSLHQLPKNSVVGTSSLRRHCQIRHHRPDIQIKDLRGNVNTRLAKLDAGEYDGIILAAAGLIRLELSHRITEFLPINYLLPANGQGAVGIECRTNDHQMQALLTALEHPPTRFCVLAERAMNRRLEGGCQVPIAAYATLADQQLTLQGLVGSLDGQQVLRAQLQGSMLDAESLGIRLAEQLLERGADTILQQVYSQTPTEQGQ